MRRIWGTTAGAILLPKVEPAELRMRWLRAVMVLLVIGGLLMALVASHGCTVKGSSPAGQGSAPITTQS